MNEPTSPVTGNHTTDGVPHGFTALTPFHTVNHADAAITFYCDVLGARLVDRTDMPDGQGGMLVAHATLDFGNGRLQLADPMPAYGLAAPPADDAVTSSIALYVRDVDATTERAVAAGATVREAASTFVSGDRFASIRDPYGIRWSLLTRVEDLSDEDSAERVRAWAEQQG